MPVALELEKVVRLPIFCHSVIDDLPMSLEAFRMYAHLARKWGNGKKGALGSYVDMGEHCYRQAFPKASSETLRRKAIASVAELQELNLLHKQTRQGHDGRNLANSYILHDLQDIVSSHQGGCDDTRGVRIHPPSAIAPLEDTNSEDTHLEDSLPLTPSRSSEVEETEREEKNQDKRTGTTPQPLATLFNLTKNLCKSGQPLNPTDPLCTDRHSTVGCPDLHSFSRRQPELIGKEEGTTVLSPEPLAFVSKQPEVIGFEPTNSVQDKCSGAVPEKICSNSNNSQLPAPTSTSQDRLQERFSRTPVQQDWEISPGIAYEAFVRWRSFHYVKQGGHWADAALANARSEIRNNPHRAADLWSQFLEYSQQAADNALAAKEAGITPILPSCFVDTTPVTKEQVIPKLEALAGVAQVVLPQAVATPSCTACAPYMSEANSANAGSPATEPTLTETPPEPYVAQLSMAVPVSDQPSDTHVLGLQIAVAELPSIQASGTPAPVSTEAVGIQAADDSLTDYQEQEQNIRRLAQMVKSISKPMPKPEREPQPTSHFEKMRSWLHGSEPALRNEAIAWMYKCQDIEPVFDEYGNPYDFTQIEIYSGSQMNKPQ